MADKNTKELTTTIQTTLQPDAAALKRVSAQTAEVKPYESFVITTAADCAEALAVIERAKDGIDLVDRIFEEPTGLAHKLWKSLTTRRAAMRKPFEQIKAATEDKIRSWKRRVEEEREANERVERERQEKIERERREMESILLDLGGNGDLADALLATPEPPPVAVSIATEVPDNLATRDNWKAVLDDLMLLAQGVAAGTVPLIAIQANQTYLNGQARLHKNALKDLIPGVHAENVEVIL